MKHRSLFKRTVALSVALVSLTTVGMDARSEPIVAQTGDNPPAPETPVTAETVGPVQADTDAPAKLVSVEKPLPPNIKPTVPVDEVIKLANSGVNESVMMAFVTNSTHTFNLGAEEIIYLNDLGVSGAVVTAMIQRDQELKSSSAGPASAAPQQVEPAPLAGEAEPPPVPDSSASYAVEAPLSPPDSGVDEQFYDSLAPYGNWVDVAGYGRCWQPTVVVVNQGWQPYFDSGHWVYSDCGWYWLSDYSWGWAPFHYGNWFRHASLGWCWMPGHTWGPSWVSWRYNDGYCGWAPLPPGAHFVAGAGLSFHGRHVGEREDFGLRPDHYHFVAWNHFNDRELRWNRLSHHEVERVYHSSTVATRISGDGSTIINNGLPVSRVAAATRRPIQTVALRDATQPVNFGGRVEHFDSGNQTLSVYRARPDFGSRTRNPTTATARATHSDSLGSSAGSAWGSRNRTDARQPGSVILKGPQNSGLREFPSPNSLVVVGTGHNRQPSAPMQPRTESAPSAIPAPSAGSARTWAQSLPRAEEPSAFAERRLESDSREDWRGTVNSSPQPSWLNENRTQRPNAGVGLARPETRPEFRGSPSVPFSGAMRSSRPAATFVPQRSFSAPTPSSAFSAPARAPSYAPSASARPAPSAPSAPSAPPSSGSHSTSSGRGNR
jgi:hypothetical protein